jgi:hypothetical protein
MARSKRNKATRKLIAYALDEFYFFLDDEIEDEIDYAITRFKEQDKRVDWKQTVRSYLCSKPAVREKIADIAEKMFP